MQNVPQYAVPFLKELDQNSKSQSTWLSNEIKHGWSPGKNAKYFFLGLVALAMYVYAVVVPLLTPNLDSSDVSIFIA